MPVLEAMRRGVPTACADATSLPEVAGDAALLFDPTSVDAIARTTARLFVDAGLPAPAGRGRHQLGRSDSPGRPGGRHWATYGRAASAASH